MTTAKRTTAPRRRPSVHITLARAARLHRLVRLLADQPQSREAILAELAIGLRTFYRELELLNRCGVKIQHKAKTYHLLATVTLAEERLPFPDPQLSFAEMSELAQHPGEAAQRLAKLLATVIGDPAATRRPGRARKASKPKGS